MSTVFIHFWQLTSSFSDEKLTWYWQERLATTMSQCDNSTRSLILDVTPEHIDMRTQAEHLQNFIDHVKRVRPTLRIFLIFNETLMKNLDLRFDKVDDIFYFDYLLMPYFGMLSKRTPYYNPSWDPDNDKLLFLIRRSPALNRIGLLRQLLDLGMENDLKWSLPGIEDGKNYFHTTTEEYIKDCLNYLPGMTEEEVQKFIEKNSKVYGPAPVSRATCSMTDSEETVKDMYSSVLGEIVSETIYDGPGPIYISEKIFKAIANHMPFIVAGQEGIEDRLKAMGFYTFEIDEVVSITDQKIISLLKNGLSPTIFFLASFHVNKFPEFYKIFKDDSWPTEIQWDELGSLLYETQAEIIEHFFSAEEIRTALRMQTLIGRILSFTETLINNKEEVKMMVEHNANRFYELGEKYVSDIKTFISKNNIDLDHLEFLELLYEKPGLDILYGQLKKSS